MTLKRIFVALFAAIALTSGNSAIAYEQATDRPAVAAGKSAADAEQTVARKAALDIRRKGTAGAKLVDINTASRAALEKLPRISAAQADQIIANRPYGSKAWLVTNKVIEVGVYDAIKGKIEAKQPFKTAEENAAMYEQLKKK